MLLKRSATLATAAIACAFTADLAMAGAVEDLTTERTVSGLTRPIFATHAPDDYNRLYIIEKQGRIRIFYLKTGVLQPVASSFLNIDALVGGGTTTNDERGLLGLAFDPDYQNNGRFYVNYTNNSGNTVIARYTVTSADQANPSSALTLRTINQPFTNHNGGWMGFGPNDGYLYISTGDGGAANDPSNRGQDITNQALAKMLRIDVNGTNGPGGNWGYPPSNPFVGVTGDDDIWAYGLRNAWRNAFDRENGDLYIADVGQNAWEEISFQKADSTGGENYGWRCREGAHNFNFSGTCGSQTFVEPFQEYSHGGSPFRCSITGGYVYRGCDIPTLDGTYFYADYCSNQIWSLKYNRDTGAVSEFTDRTNELDPPSFFAITSITSFGEDMRGEMYICDQNGGEVFKIVPVTPTISLADFNCDGDVGFSDLTQLLNKWGPCVGCQEDIDGDDEIGFSDLTFVLAEWG